MFFACGIWCLADISSVSPSSEQSVTTDSRPSLSLPLTTDLKDFGMGCTELYIIKNLYGRLFDLFYNWKKGPY